MQKRRLHLDLLRVSWMWLALGALVAIFLGIRDVVSAAATFGLAALCMILALAEHVWPSERRRTTEVGIQPKAEGALRRLQISGKIGFKQVNGIDNAYIEMKGDTVTVKLGTVLMQHCNEEQLTAVVAHELAHLRQSRLAFAIKLILASWVTCGVGFVFALSQGAPLSVTIPAALYSLAACPMLFTFGLWKAEFDADQTAAAVLLDCACSVESLREALTALCRRTDSEHASLTHPSLTKRLEMLERF